jgi:hypothetical protein
MAIAGGEDYSGCVSQDDPKDIDAGRTIQLEPGDALNQVQLVDPAPPAPTVSTRPPPPGSRKTPPPLPPSPSLAPLAPVAPLPAEPPKRAITGKTIAIFVVLVAVCAVIGMTVGNWARDRQSSAPMPGAASAPAGGVMVLPPVEMQSEPSASPSSPTP